jgi:hypothetical protein
MAHSTQVYPEIRLRPLIELKAGLITHNGKPCKVVLTPSLISVGCSDVSPEALRGLIEHYDRHFPDHKQVVVIQPGPEEKL